MQASLSGCTPWVTLSPTSNSLVAVGLWPGAGYAGVNAFYSGNYVLTGAGQQGVGYTASVNPPGPGVINSTNSVVL